jgi:hypothetical protein
MQVAYQNASPSPTPVTGRAYGLDARRSLRSTTGSRLEVAQRIPNRRAGCAERAAQIVFPPRRLRKFRHRYDDDDARDRCRYRGRRGAKRSAIDCRASDCHRPCLTAPSGVVAKGSPPAREGLSFPCHMDRFTASHPEVSSTASVRRPNEGSRLMPAPFGCVLSTVTAPPNRQELTDTIFLGVVRQSGNDAPVPTTIIAGQAHIHRYGPVVPAQTAADCWHRSTMPAESDDAHRIVHCSKSCDFGTVRQETHPPASTLCHRS